MTDNRSNPVGQDRGAASAVGQQSPETEGCLAHHGPARERCCARRRRAWRGASIESLEGNEPPQEPWSSGIQPPRRNAALREGPPPSGGLAAGLQRLGAGESRRTRVPCRPISRPCAKSPASLTRPCAAHENPTATYCRPARPARRASDREGMRAHAGDTSPERERHDDPQSCSARLSLGCAW